ncbi:MAG: tyrosine-type recombinase/integrase [Alphaproteobacteria bacterium]|nr:tyrosine-type recombinase/integrase [Alphaproteobacteria bacterium]
MGVKNSLGLASIRGRRSPMRSDGRHNWKGVMRGTATRLTQAFVNGAASMDKAKARFWDSGVPGLVLTVTKNGGKTYCAVYRDLEGRQREPRIGDAKVVTLEQARKAAIDLLATSQLEGRDPVAERRAAKAAAIERRQWTFDKLAEVYLTDGELRRSPARQAMEKMYVRKHLGPRFGDTPLAELTTAALSTALCEISVNSGQSASNTNLEVVRQMLSFAVDRGWVSSNVARGIKPYPKVSRERVATEDELRLIWRSLDVAKADGRIDCRDAARAIQFALLTLQRRGEVAGLHFREIDWAAKVWTIPGPRTKNKKGPHLVPLSGAALNVLLEAFGKRKDGFAFTGRDAGALDVKVISRAFARLVADLGIEDLTVHDLRRTGATMLTSERLAVIGEIVSRILNHTPPGPAVTLIYNRNSYLPQKRAALDAWSQEVLRMLTIGREGLPVLS